MGKTFLLWVRRDHFGKEDQIFIIASTRSGVITLLTSIFIYTSPMSTASGEREAHYWIWRKAANGQWSQAEAWNLSRCFSGGICPSREAACVTAGILARLRSCWREHGEPWFLPCILSVSTNKTSWFYSAFYSWAHCQCAYPGLRYQLPPPSNPALRNRSMTGYIQTLWSCLRGTLFLYIFWLTFKI